jgi:hypothetical protein
MKPGNDLGRCRAFLFAACVSYLTSHLGRPLLMIPASE